jgi:DNA processing protein
LRDDFPKQLLEIPQPPKKLFIRGSFPSKTSMLLAVVGARKYTSYGKEVCTMLIEGLGGYNVSIISGLALGIDAIAHEAALAAQLHTTAIPGSGLNDEILAENILSSGGALLSEFDPDFKATPFSFPQRNRIMVGLSHAVLIIEAERKSGTLITSRLAVEYNRDVLTVPGSVFSKNSEGPHMLLTLGATPICTADDLREALGLEKKATRSETAYADCSPQERKILEILNEPMNKEELAHRLTLCPSELNATLSRMEIKGLIKEVYGELRIV